MYQLASSMRGCQETRSWQDFQERLTMTCQDLSSIKNSIAPKNKMQLEIMRLSKNCKELARFINNVRKYCSRQFINQQLSGFFSNRNFLLTTRKFHIQDSVIMESHNTFLMVAKRVFNCTDFVYVFTLLDYARFAPITMFFCLIIIAFFSSSFNLRYEVAYRDMNALHRANSHKCESQLIFCLDCLVMAHFCLNF